MGQVRVIDPWQGIDHYEASQDWAGLVRGPALTDLYAHSGEPGNEQRETFVSLLQAAQAGGYGEITILPDTQPPLDQVSTIRALPLALNPSLKVNVLGAMTLGCRGEQPVEAQELAPWVAGFTDNRPIAQWSILRNFLEYSQSLGRPLFVFPRTAQLHRGVAREGKIALELGLPSLPDWAETSAVGTLLELVRLTGTPLHLMRLGTAAGIALVRQGKAAGLPISASVTVAQLIHTETEILSLDPQWRFDPPLGSVLDQQALWEGLRDGTIDAIASDHTPWTYAEKTLPFTQAPSGSLMLELALPLLWSHLVVPGHLEALTLWRALTVGPRRILGKIDPLERWITFDPETHWTVNPSTIHSLSSNSPWWGKTVQGKVC